MKSGPSNYGNIVESCARPLAFYRSLNNPRIFPRKANSQTKLGPLGTNLLGCFGIECLQVPIDQFLVGTHNRAGHRAILCRAFREFGLELADGAAQPLTGGIGGVSRLLWVSFMRVLIRH